MPMTWEEGRARGIRWEKPRNIRRLEVEFEEETRPPDPSSVRIEYWHRHWNGKADPILAETGAGGYGWIPQDDWFNGQWRTASVVPALHPDRWVFTFRPTGEEGFPDLGEPGVSYRKTLQMRIVSDGVLPPCKAVRAYTDSAWRPLRVRIEWTAEEGKPVDWSGRLEVHNGKVERVEPLPRGGVAVRPDGSWISAIFSGSDGIVADLWMAVNPVNPRYDRTIVTVRGAHHPFSFYADQAAAGDRIYVPDFGVLVVRESENLSLADYVASRKEMIGKSIYDRVFDEPEQTLSRAWDEMPLKRPFYFVLGCEGGRDCFRLDPNGDVSTPLHARWFRGLPGKDTPRLLWNGEDPIFGFGFPDTGRAGRSLEDGYLPVMRTAWFDGGLAYEQTVLADRLFADILTDPPMEGDDPTVLMMKVRLVNATSPVTETAVLRLSINDNGKQQLEHDGDSIYTRHGDERRFRYRIDTGGKGSISKKDGDLLYNLKLAPRRSHEIFVTIPFITLAGPEEIETLRTWTFETSHRRVTDYWRRRTGEGCRIHTPEPWLDDFYRAHARHLLINCRREIGSDRLMAHVGTFTYGVYTNESSMMISDLDRRGYHETAAKCLESFLHYQGTVGLPGNYRTKEGQIYGAGGHESGGYNQHHGWGLWCLAEHWWYTRDREWLERAAPGMVAACDWITRERKATMTAAPDGTRPIEYGFLPAGSLEDVTDYWYWLSTNAYTAWGFDNVARALADAGHPEAERISRDCEAFWNDLEAGFTESRVRTPVVRLRDGTCVPHFPSRLYERGRSVGWIRETLEGAIHLIRAGLVKPESPEALWILEDFEDNLYVSDDYGYSIPVFDRFWFSRGGFSMQANLLCSPIPYLERDDVRHYIRTYFNAFASAFYPETRMCNEHSLPELGYPAGDHFKSSDEANSTFWLRLMFIHEFRGDLYLGRAIPRYWLADGNRVGIERAATYYGPTEVWYESRAKKGEIEATFVPPTRNRPETIYVRFRHPEEARMKSAAVNGKEWKDFDPEKEWVVLPGDVEGEVRVVARY